jgi:hypothetical protein
MLKRITDHQIYEVWSEWAAESVYVDHKPSQKEVYYLWKKLWQKTPSRPEVFKLKSLYGISPAQYRLARGED